VRGLWTTNTQIVLNVPIVLRGVTKLSIANIPIVLFIRRRHAEKSGLLVAGVAMRDANRIGRLMETVAITFVTNPYNLKKDYFLLT
jgi:hypothetical protein